MRGGLPERLAASLSAALGCEIDPDRASRVAGGDINEAWRVDTPRGRLFVKTHARPPAPTRAGEPSFFAAEARGLEALKPTPVPEVLAVLDDALVLEWLEDAPETVESSTAAGRALAALHQRPGPRFGLDFDNFMGAIPQDNRPASRPDFATFFLERRLLPFVDLLPSSTARRLERLPLSELLSDTTPRLVHGDLWAGNLMHTTLGPRFIDPAPCFGHPEQDLAMTRLFGGFSPAFYDAYREVRPEPFDATLDQRLEVLTLYPLLIHVALFGGGYLRRVEQILERHAR